LELREGHDHLQPHLKSVTGNEAGENVAYNNNGALAIE
jgi:hypothetical protein